MLTSGGRDSFLLRGMVNFQQDYLMKLNADSYKKFYAFLLVLPISISLLVPILLGARQIFSFDLGYHLAFGESFFESGKIVDHTPFIYTLPAQETSPADRPEPGPSCWYDDKGSYRFPNANWLSQVFMYASWYLAGDVGPTILQYLIVIGIFLPLLTVMRKNIRPIHLQSLGILLMALILNSRLNMRPELFGYLCLVIQYWMLSKILVDKNLLKTPSWSWILGMIAMQLLFTNFHSYFLLGLAVTGAVLAHFLLTATEKCLFDKNNPQLQIDKKIIFRLGITLIGMVAISFANPWGWKLVFLPFQTLQYLKENVFTANASIHPWNIAEFTSTLHENWPASLADYALLAVIVLACLALVSQLALLLFRFYINRHPKRTNHIQNNAFKVRWGYLFMIIGMMFIGLKMTRNTAVASLIVVPSSLICINDCLQYFSKNTLRRFRSTFSVIASLLVTTLSLYTCYQIITGNFYNSFLKIPTRFGFGISRHWLPTGPAKWLNKYAPDARVWCDFESSSTIHFFTIPHKDVPILTNTWAYPPSVKSLNDYYRTGIGIFNYLDKNNIDAVALRPENNKNIIRLLAGNENWKMVYIKGYTVLFLRSDGRFKPIAIQHEIRTDTFNINSFVYQQILEEPSFKLSILPVSQIFRYAGNLDLAIDLINNALKYDDSDVMTWKELHILYNNRSYNRQQRGDNRFVLDYQKGLYALRKSTELASGNNKNN